MYHQSTPQPPANAARYFSFRFPVITAVFFAWLVRALSRAKLVANPDGAIIDQALGA